MDEDGEIRIGVDNKGEPLRGTGSGFEQDLLVFERVEGGSTSIIPRVVAEVKVDGVTTHDCLTYSEKARRIRVVYPFVRYGMILGRMNTIPPRVLRLGQEFDFILVVHDPTSHEEVDVLGRLFQEEIQASKNLGLMFSGRKRIEAVVRSLGLVFE